jgi:hypothetical protein
MASSTRNRSGRPRGEIRDALSAWAAIAATQPQAPALTIPELVALVPGMRSSSSSDVLLVRWTVENMVRAGELCRDDSTPSKGRACYHRRFLPAKPAENAQTAADVLAAVLSSWSRAEAADVA